MGFSNPHSQCVRSFKTQSARQGFSNPESQRVKGLQTQRKLASGIFKQKELV